VTKLSPVLVGQETEYALTAFDASGRPVDRARTLDRLMDVARRQLVCLAGDARYDLYLRNGARLYIDSGLHPEWSTPECSSPGEVLAHARAGDATLARIAAALQREDPDISDIVITKCNVDYADRRATWGCHESYLHRKSRRGLAKHLIPHLVSRVVYAGAGGLNPLSPGIAFMVSPRVAHLQAVVSDSSTANRGIFHTKKEPLCGMGYDRLHLICGESLCSQRADFLRWGATALVVRLIDAGKAPAAEVQLAAPLTAMRSFASDSDCRAEVPLAVGGNTTAIRIQRHYLRNVESCLRAPFMPAWAEQVCRCWREILDALEEDAGRAATLDWVVKRTLFQRRAAKLGLTWGSLPFLTSVVAQLDRRLQEPEPGTESDEGERRSLIAGLHDGRWREGRKLRRELKLVGLSEDVLEDFLSLRQELAEIDVRFGQIGSKGIFANLAQLGMFGDGFVSAEDIETAAAEPPPATRARVRGEWIGRLVETGADCYCSWDRIIDRRDERFLDFRDPFQREAAWAEMATSIDWLPTRRRR